MLMNERRLIVASANPDKAAEINRVLAALIPDLVLVARPISVPDVVEDADTLLGNARLKAQALCTATGVASVADDTGLFVDALGGEPGVFSARYAGDDATYADNCTKLLRELMVVSAHTRSARSAVFRTIAIVVWPDGMERWAEGMVSGSIATEPRGVNGFGYDSLFVPDSLAVVDESAANELTFAQLGSSVKNQMSHRAQAFAALAPALAAEFFRRQTA